MQSKIDSLREINSKLLAKITELKKENAERDKEKTTLIAKLDDDIRKIKQEQNAVNILAQSNTSILKSPIDSIPLPLTLSTDLINISPVTDQYDTTESVKHFNSKLLEDDKKTDAFLNEMHKKKGNNEIRQRNQEKKLSQSHKVEQDLICELFEFIRCHNSTSLLNSISSKHISFDTIPLGSTDLTPGSISHLAHLFNKAEKTG
ncbi:hypothetical protein RhiirC2_787641 [Rhizophagus irregularis]|uniref:Uncharacterized protein n=1 Tax=Rhizophagus irregularis TaxID=588596 RepID=A0A2N1MRU4_9GLOM|nr:hypothetical protein RhiirC2_787641 [Rhizophagus irregularis]